MLRMSRFRSVAGRLSALPLYRCFTELSPEWVLDARARRRRPDAHAALGELVAQLLKGLVAEVAQVQQVVLGHARKLANARDAVPLQAVQRAIGELEVVHR